MQQREGNFGSQELSSVEAELPATCSRGNQSAAVAVAVAAVAIAAAARH